MVAIKPTGKVGMFLLTRMELSANIPNLGEGRRAVDIDHSVESCPACTRVWVQLPEHWGGGLVRWFNE